MKHGMMMIFEMDNNKVIRCVTQSSENVYFEIKTRRLVSPARSLLSSLSLHTYRHTVEEVRVECRGTKQFNHSIFLYRQYV